MIIFGDSMKKLDRIEPNSISLCLTDPPYFLDKLDDKWDNDKVLKNTKNTTSNLISSLPGGMKFDTKQGLNFYKWYLKISKKIYKTLKPGAFYLSFSSPRLYHRLGLAVEDAGFMIRDTFMWVYIKSQPKAMSLNHFVDKMDISDNEKSRIKEQMYGWKTPFLKQAYEPICVAQKPYENTLLNNFIKYNTGLLNVTKKVGLNNDKFPSNFLTTEIMLDNTDKYFLVKKPKKEVFNTHLTVKPVPLCTHLIELFSYSKNDIILDPFAGSGTTAVSAMELDRKFIIIERDKNNIKIINKRVEGATTTEKQEKIINRFF